MDSERQPLLATATVTSYNEESSSSVTLPHPSSSSPSIIPSSSSSSSVHHHCLLPSPSKRPSSSRRSKHGCCNTKSDRTNGDEDNDSDGEFHDEKVSIIIGTNRRETMPQAFVALGFTFAILAGICFTSTNTMIKLVPQMNSWHLMLVRCFVQMLCMLPIIWWTKAPMIFRDCATNLKIFAQGSLGGLLLLSLFLAVTNLPLGDATAMFFSSPAFTMLLSTFLLKDHCGIYRTLIAVILLTGVVILARPPALFPRSPPIPSNKTGSFNITSPDYDDDDNNYNLVGIIAGIAVPILSAWVAIVTRQARHVHYSVLVFWFGAGGFVVSIIGTFSISETTIGIFDWNCLDWIMANLIAIFGVLGSIVMTKAVCWVTPSKVMVIRSFEVVAAYLLQLTIFNNPPHYTDLAGTLLIMVAVLTMGIEDCVMSLTDWRWL